MQSDSYPTIDKIEKALEEYESGISAEFKIKVEQPDCLFMAIADLRKKPPEVLAEYTIELNRYSLYIHSIINKLKGWIRWAEASLDEAASLEIVKIPQGYSWEERKILSRNTSDNCKRINKFLRETRLKFDRLNGTPDQIKIISDSIRDLKFMAMRREKEEFE